MKLVAVVAVVVAAASKLAFNEALAPIKLPSTSSPDNNDPPSSSSLLLSTRCCWMGFFIPWGVVRKSLLVAAGSVIDDVARPASLFVAMALSSS